MTSCESHFPDARKPTCLLDAIGASAGDVVVGFALDGFALHAPVDGLELDECHATEVDGDYRYYITTEAPYLPPCLKGDRLGTVATEAVTPPVACPKRTLTFESDSNELDDARDCSTAAGGAFSESAGDPAAVDPFAAGGGGGFISVSTGAGAAGSATVVGCEAGAAGGASLGFSTRVELCEKLSAALISGAWATSVVAGATRDVICRVPEFRGGS